MCVCESSPKLIWNISPKATLHAAKADRESVERLRNAKDFSRALQRQRAPPSFRRGLVRSANCSERRPPCRWLCDRRRDVDSMKRQRRRLDWGVRRFSKLYLQTHLALISANFIFQEKDAHFVKKCPFDGTGQEKIWKDAHWTGKDANWTGKDAHFFLKMNKDAHFWKRRPKGSFSPNGHLLVTIRRTRYGLKTTTHLLSLKGSLWDLASPRCHPVIQLLISRPSEVEIQPIQRGHFSHPFARSKLNLWGCQVLQGCDAKLKEVKMASQMVSCYALKCRFWPGGLFHLLGRRPEEQEIFTERACLASVPKKTLLYVQKRKKQAGPSIWWQLPPASASFHRLSGGPLFWIKKSWKNGRLPFLGRYLALAKHMEHPKLSRPFVLLRKCLKWRRVGRSYRGKMKRPRKIWGKGI